MYEVYYFYRFPFFEDLVQRKPSNLLEICSLEYKNQQLTHLKKEMAKTGENCDQVRLLPCNHGLSFQFPF